MTTPVTLDTPRLRLRPWQQSDYRPFARLNADHEVMRFFPATLSSVESDTLANTLQDNLEKNGWGIWALELKSTEAFIGFTGIQCKQGMSFSPCVEIGWRLAKEYWRQGFATEAARQALTFAFSHLQLTEVVAFTTVTNLPSRGVMEKLQMHNTGRNFQHPALPIGHKFREHVLYNIEHAQWHNHQ